MPSKLKHVNMTLLHTWVSTQRNRHIGWYTCPQRQDFPQYKRGFDQPIHDVGMCIFVHLNDTHLGERVSGRLLTLIIIALTIFTIN